jgi:biopolymer transport protein ExbB/biopolymer transport protein TolQ
MKEEKIMTNAYALFAMWMLETAGDFSLAGLGKNFGPIGWVVVSILLLMSVWSFGVILDRALMYAAARKQSRAFVQQVAGALREGKLDEAIRIAERNRKSHIAKVTATGLAEFQQAPSGMDHDKVVESARRSLERSVAIVHAEFERGLASLATIGSTAPFVGLFGTVVGILNAFRAMAVTKAPGFTTVAGAIGEALVATALGLLVAIPAVWAFNIFTSRLKSFNVEMDNSSMELINYFVSRLEERR